MSVVITGGAGLLGSSLVRRLLAKGVQRPVVMDITRSPDRLNDILDEIEYINGDLGNFNTTLNVIKQHRPTTIYHIGAMLGQVAEEDPAGAIRVNVMGTFYLMEAARLFEVPQLLFSSSISIFGEGLEDAPEFRDNLLQRPMSFYGLTKQFNEGTGLFFKRKYGLDYRSIRYPSIVGPGLREGGIMNYPAAMIEYALKGERFTVDAEPTTKIAVIHIDDAVRGMIELSCQPIEKIRTVNYLIDGVKPSLSAKEMAEEVRTKIPGAQIDFGPSPFQDILDTVAKPIDDSPARAEWGWEPSYDYGRIIEDFIRKAKQD